MSEQDRLRSVIAQAEHRLASQSQVALFHVQERNDTYWAKCFYCRKHPSERPPKRCTRHNVYLIDSVADVLVRAHVRRAVRMADELTALRSALAALELVTQ